MSSISAPFVDLSGRMIVSPFELTRHMLNELNAYTRRGLVQEEDCPDIYLEVLALDEDWRVFELALDRIKANSDLLKKTLLRYLDADDSMFHTGLSIRSNLPISKANRKTEHVSYRIKKVIKCLAFRSADLCEKIIALENYELNEFLMKNVLSRLDSTEAIRIWNVMLFHSNPKIRYRAVRAKTRSERSPVTKPVNFKDDDCDCSACHGSGESAMGGACSSCGIGCAYCSDLYCRDFECLEDEVDLFSGMYNRSRFVFKCEFKLGSIAF